MSEKIKIMNSIEATMTGRERFNAFQTGYGVHKTLKHPNRAKKKSDLKKEINKYI